MIRKIKKGFTLVELVVVIAVIAILAAVSVVSYVGITKKAKESKDHMVIDQVNSVLVNSQILQKKMTVHEIVERFEAEEGYDVRTMKPELDGTQFVYSYEKGMFGYWKDTEEKIIYPEALENLTNTNDIWFFDETIKAEYTDVYSHYINLETTTTSTISTKSGFDAGKCTGIESLTLNRVGLDKANKDVVINTNGGDLTINAENDKVFHYGKVDSLNIIAVAPTSYHEKGTVGYAMIANGRLVVEETANIDGIYLVANEQGEFDGIKIAVVGGAKLPEIARADVELSDGQSKLVVEVQTLETSDGTDANPEYVWISKSGSEVNAVVSSSDNSSDYSSHVVTNPSEAAAATKEEAKQSAAPVTDDSVARIGAVGYATLQLALDSAVEGATVVLLKDVSGLTPVVTLGTESNKYCVAIAKSLTLDGNGHSIALNSIPSLGKFRGFGVKGTNSNYLDVVIKNVTITQSGSISGISNNNTLHVFDTRGCVNSISFENVDISSNELYGQIFTIGGSQSRVTNVTMKNSKITGANDKASYTVTVFNPMNLKIEDSELTGWSCLNLKGINGSIGSRGSVITVDKSTFNCVNPYTGDTNNFGAVKFEDTGGTAASVTITNTEINLTSWQGKYEAIGAYDPSAKGVLNLGTGVVMNSYGASGATPIVCGTSDKGEISITGGSYTVDPTSFVDRDNYDVCVNEGIYTVTAK
jgi:prepilin-type N-terminal cleavage/methylation domain-containing protein